MEEVGSIHTVQGYGLNYVGVIIGKDLRLDPAIREMWCSIASSTTKRIAARTTPSGASPTQMTTFCNTSGTSTRCS